MPNKLLIGQIKQTHKEKYVCIDIHTHIECCFVGFDPSSLVKVNQHFGRISSGSKIKPIKQVLIRAIHCD